MRYNGIKNDMGSRIGMGSEPQIRLRQDGTGPVELDLARELRLVRGDINKDARVDVDDAGRRTLKSWWRFAARPEEKLSMATAFDGKSIHDRSRDQSRKITHVITEFLDGAGDVLGLPPSGPFRAIDFVLARPMKGDMPMGDVQMPRSVNMALLMDKDQPRAVLLNGELGLHDMVTEAQNGIAMSLVEMAKKQGVNVAKGPAWARLVAVKNGEFPSKTATPDLFKAEDGPLVSVKFQGRRFMVPAECYTAKKVSNAGF